MTEEMTTEEERVEALHDIEVENVRACEQVEDNNRYL